HGRASKRKAQRALFRNLGSYGGYRKRSVSENSRISFQVQRELKMN
ncbi:unnamed protein product, partial [marine sediment metagenome]